MTLNIVSILVAIIAFVAYRIYQDSWTRVKKIDPHDFDLKSNFTIKEIPVTYYNLNELDKVLTTVS